MFTFKHPDISEINFMLFSMLGKLGNFLAEKFNFNLSKDYFKKLLGDILK